MKKLKNFFNRFKILFKNLTLNYTGRLFTILSAFHIALYIAKQQVPTFSLVLVPASIFPFVSAVKDCLDCRKCPYPTITKSLKKGSWMKKSICYNLARRFWGAFLPDISLEGRFFLDGDYGLCSEEHTLYAVVCSTFRFMDDQLHLSKCAIQRAHCRILYPTILAWPYISSETNEQVISAVTNLYLDSFLEI